jgi:hypothetical protein
LPAYQSRHKPPCRRRSSLSRPSPLSPPSPHSRPRGSAADAAPEDDAAAERFFDARGDALWPLGEVMPTTLAGAALLLATAYKDEADFISENSALHNVVANVCAFLEAADA